MSIIYSEAWYDDMKNLINGSDEFAAQAPQERLSMTLEVNADGVSPYVQQGEGLFFLVVLEKGRVIEFAPLDGRHDGKGLDFRFTAPAGTWENIAAGLADPITVGLRGGIKIRGDMRFLMKNADAVKILVDLYGNQVTTDWPSGKPPYDGASANAAV